MCSRAWCSSVCPSVRQPVLTCSLAVNSQQCMPSRRCTEILLCREAWAAREAMQALKGCCPTRLGALLAPATIWLEEAWEAQRWGLAAS